MAAKKPKVDLDSIAEQIKALPKSKKSILKGGDGFSSFVQRPVESDLANGTCESIDEELERRTKSVKTRTSVIKILSDDLISRTADINRSMGVTSTGKGTKKNRREEKLDAEVHESQVADMLEKLALEILKKIETVSPEESVEIDVPFFFFRFLNHHDGGFFDTYFFQMSHFTEKNDRHILRDLPSLVTIQNSRKKVMGEILELLDMDELGDEDDDAALSTTLLDQKYLDLMPDLNEFAFLGDAKREAFLFLSGTEPPEEQWLPQQDMQNEFMPSFDSHSPIQRPSPRPHVGNQSRVTAGAPHPSEKRDVPETRPTQKKKDAPKKPRKAGAAAKPVAERSEQRFGLLFDMNLVPAAAPFVAPTTKTWKQNYRLSFAPAFLLSQFVFADSQNQKRQH